MVKQRLHSPSETQLRNLKQFADMNEGDFEEYLQDSVGPTLSRADKKQMEKAIKEKLSDFDDDYDLSDLKINDRLVLRNLIRAIITLEDLENEFYALRKDISNSNILLLDRLSKVMNHLRRDISDMQDDLKLTRRIRKESQEENFATYLENLQEKARKFYRQKMLYIFCPECKRLLSTVWLLQTEANNVLNLECSNCSNKFATTLSEIYMTDNRNIENVKIP